MRIWYHFKALPWYPEAKAKHRPLAAIDAGNIDNAHFLYH